MLVVNRPFFRSFIYFYFFFLTLTSDLFVWQVNQWLTWLETAEEEESEEEDY